MLQNGQQAAKPIQTKYLAPADPFAAFVSMFDWFYEHFLRVSVLVSSEYGGPFGPFFSFKWQGEKTGKMAFLNKTASSNSV